MEGGPHIEQQRTPQGDWGSERVEERHHSKHRIRRLWMHDLLDCLHVHCNVVVREHHALRQASRTGSEYHRRYIVAADSVQAEDAIEDGRWYKKRVQRSKQLVAAEHFFAKIFEDDELGL